MNCLVTLFAGSRFTSFVFAKGLRAFQCLADNDWIKLNEVHQQSALLLAEGMKARLKESLYKQELETT